MGRGIRVHTREMVEIVREQKPFAIGPLLGQLAMKFNISASMIAELLRVHEQTVLRWYMGYSEPAASVHRKMAQLLVFFLWLKQEDFQPFTGGAKSRKSAFAKTMREFLAAD